MMDIVKDFYTQYNNLTINVDVNLSMILGIFSVINVLYYPLDWYFSKNYSKYSTLPFHRKRYIIKNILKSFYLLFLTFYSSFILINAFVYNIWDNYMIHQLGLMYMMPDLISLFRVPKLHLNTIQHHITVVILAILNLFCDYSEDTYWKGLMIYSYMSMVTFIVNFYLGYRLLEDDQKKKSDIALAALIVYGGSIIVNWSYQCFIFYKWLFSSFPLYGLYFYMFLIYWVVKDDIVLMSFLLYTSQLSQRLKPIYHKIKGKFSG